MTIDDDDGEFDSAEEAISYYRELLRANEKQKRALEVQNTEYGIATPAYVRTELERVSSEIKRLRELIKTRESVTSRSKQLSSPNSMTDLKQAVLQLYRARDAVLGIHRARVILLIYHYNNLEPDSAYIQAQADHSVYWAELRGLVLQ